MYDPLNFLVVPKARRRRAERGTLVELRLHLRYGLNPPRRSVQVTGNSA